MYPLSPLPTNSRIWKLFVVDSKRKISHLQERVQYFVAVTVMFLVSVGNETISSSSSPYLSANRSESAARKHPSPSQSRLDIQPQRCRSTPECWWRGFQMRVRVQLQAAPLTPSQQLTAQWEESFGISLCRWSLRWFWGVWFELTPTSTHWYERVDSTSLYAYIYISVFSVTSNSKEREEDLLDIAFSLAFYSR